MRIAYFRLLSLCFSSCRLAKQSVSPIQPETDFAILVADNHEIWVKKQDCLDYFHKLDSQKHDIKNVTQLKYALESYTPCKFGTTNSGAPKIDSITSNSSFDETKLELFGVLFDLAFKLAKRHKIYVFDFTTKQWVNYHTKLFKGLHGKSIEIIDENGKTILYYMLAIANATPRNSMNMNGLDLYDFHARQYDPVLGRFTTPDPLSEKYYHLSPYAYCASNPLRYIDPTGMELNLVGSIEDIKSVLDIYNKGMGYKCKTIVDEKNKVSLIESDSFNQMSKQEKLYYGFLKKSIKSENTININVTRDSKVVIGDVKSQKIDIGDIERIGDGEWVNSSSVLLHETVEQHNIQSSKMPIVNAHINAAESAEYGVTSVYPDPINRLTDYNGVMSIYIYNNNKKEKQIGIVKIKIDLTSGNIINKEEEKCE